jgi:trehalose 6-phosphate phosphatase
MIILNQKVNLEKFFQDLSKAKKGLLILDYDGTLAPFSKNPDNVHPYPGVYEKIKKIMASRHTKVVILSGRDLQGLKELVKINPLPELWGSHGGERLQINSLNPIVKRLDPMIKKLLAMAFADAKLLATGLYCEVKPLSIALHWRGRDADIVQEQGLRVLERWKKMILGHPLEIHEFNGGIELRPQGVNKGEAVKTLLKEVPPDTVIAYLGDDFTDEEAFEILGDRALKILVRKLIKSTKADIHLVPPDQLLWFLDRWIKSQTEEFS